MSTITANQDLSPLFETDDASEEPHACDYETDEEEFNPEANTSRGNSTRQQVYLGQSNESSGDILVIDPEYPQRQDEHPCGKTVWEMDAGVGGRVAEYETDEEEFLGEEYGSTELAKHQHQVISVPTPVPAKGAPKTRNIAKRNTVAATDKSKKKKGAVAQGYQLAYLNLWWSRMARDAKRDQEDKCNQKRVEVEYRSKERMMGWLEQRRLFSSEASGNVSDIKEVECMHHFQVDSELEVGVTSNVRGVSIWEQRVGNVLSTDEDEEMIHEHSQAEQILSTQSK